MRDGPEGNKFAFDPHVDIGSDKDTLEIKKGARGNEDENGTDNAEKLYVDQKLEMNRRRENKMSKMDISNYQVDLSDYNYLTKDMQNNPKLRKTIEKGAERVS